MLSNDTGASAAPRRPAVGSAATGVPVTVADGDGDTNGVCVGVGVGDGVEGGAAVGAAVCVGAGVCAGVGATVVTVGAMGVGEAAAVSAGNTVGRETGSAGDFNRNHQTTPAITTIAAPMPAQRPTAGEGPGATGAAGGIDAVVSPMPLVGTVTGAVRLTEAVAAVPPAPAATGIVPGIIVSASSAEMVTAGSLFRERGRPARPRWIASRNSTAV